MELSEFKASLRAAAPPERLRPPLQALWYEAKGQWDRAHRLVQPHGDAASAWVHAYLHRAEGDEANAGYWYRRAGRPRATAPLAEEWEEIAAALL